MRSAGDTSALCYIERQHLLGATPIQHRISGSRKRLDDQILLVMLFRASWQRAVERVEPNPWLALAAAHSIHHICGLV
jgi:hypothetical protein